MQHDLIDLDPRFQTRGATFHQNPSPKHILLDTTRTKMVTHYLRHDASISLCRYWDRIKKKTPCLPVIQQQSLIALPSDLEEG